jgi:hypothetical protein
MSQRVSRRSAAEWQQLITEQRQSGDTRDAFCQSRAIAPTAFQSAVARHRERGAEKGSGVVIFPAIARSGKRVGSLYFSGNCAIPIDGGFAVAVNFSHAATNAPC